MLPFCLSASLPPSPPTTHTHTHYSSFVRCNDNDASASAALTFAAAFSHTLVAADSATAAALTSAGLTQRADLRGKAVKDVLAMAGALSSLSSRVFVFQDPKKSVRITHRVVRVFVCCVLIYVDNNAL